MCGWKSVIRTNTAVDTNKTSGWIKDSKKSDNIQSSGWTISGNKSSGWPVQTQRRTGWQFSKSSKNWGKHLYHG